MDDETVDYKELYLKQMRANEAAVRKPREAEPKAVFTGGDPPILRKPP